MLANKPPAFQAKIRAIAEVAKLTDETVYAMWQQYSDDCRHFDQSPVFFEFVDWYSAKLGGDRRALLDAIEG